MIYQSKKHKEVFGKAMIKAKLKVRGLCVLANTLDSFIFVPNVSNMEQLSAQQREYVFY